jgi:hypothetical protein
MGPAAGAVAPGDPASTPLGRLLGKSNGLGDVVPPRASAAKDRYPAGSPQLDTRDAMLPPGPTPPEMITMKLTKVALVASLTALTFATAACDKKEEPKKEEAKKDEKKDEKKEEAK